MSVFLYLSQHLLVFLLLIILFNNFPVTILFDNSAYANDVFYKQTQTHDHGTDKQTETDKRGTTHLFMGAICVAQRFFLCCKDVLMRKCFRFIKKYIDRHIHTILNSHIPNENHKLGPVDLHCMCM